MPISSTDLNKAYLAYFGRPSDISGRATFANKELADVVSAFDSSAESKALYGDSIVNKINAIYVNLFNRDAEPAGLQHWLSKVMSGELTPAGVAIAILNGAQNDDAKAVANKLAAADAFTKAIDTSAEILGYSGMAAVNSARTFLKTVDATEASLTAAVKNADTAVATATNAGSAQANQGQTFTLTTGIETVTGTSGNDTINGTVNTPNLIGDTSTLNSGDVINGGTGTDTLNLTILATALAIDAPVAELNSIEVVNIRNLGTAAAVPLSGATWTGVTQIWNDRSIGAATTVDVVDVQNNVTVGVRSVNGALNATNVTFDDTVFAAGGTAQLALDNAGREVNGVITDANVNLDTALVNGRVNALSIAATGENYLNLQTGAGGILAGGATGVTTLTVTGAGTVEIDSTSSISAGTLRAELTTVNASANSGGLIAELSNADVKVTGGSGNDEITLSNAAILTSKAGISLGAGDDALLSNGSAGVGTSAVLDGGTGSDTISSLLVEVGNRDNIRNFEVLDVTGDNRLIDSSLFTSSAFNALAVSGAIGGGGVTVTKLAGTALNVEVSDVAANNLTASLAGGATGEADSLNVTFDANGGGAASLATITTSGTETVTINSGGVAGVDVNAITLIADTLNTVKSITITGANDFTLGGVRLNTSAEPAAVTAVATTVAGALTLIDGSAATGDLNITAGASLTTNNLTMTYNSLTIKTGSGDDTISIGGRGTVEAGEGADTVTVNALGVSVNVGVDNDVDTVVLAASADFATAFGPTTRVTTISNLAQGDIIDFSSIAAAAGAINDFTVAGKATGSLETAVNEAIADVTAAVDFINWVDGNTYIVVNGTDDTVIKLIGTYDDFNIATGVITIA